MARRAAFEKPCAHPFPTCSELQASACGRYAIDIHIGAENFWYHYGPVRLLVVLHYSNPSAADGQSGTVQSMDKIALAASLGLEADAGATSLKGFAVRAGGNLAKLLAGGKPNFEVIGFCGSKSHVTGTK